MKYLRHTLLAFLLAILSFSAQAVSYSVYAMGDSWLAGTYNPQATYDLDYYMTVPTGNYALNSEKTEDLLWHLNYLTQAGQNINWGSNATVVIDIGLPDFFSGVPRATTQANLFQIVDKLTARGIKVILSGAPDSDNSGDLLQLPLEIDPLYAAVKAHNPAVTILDLQSKFMKIPQVRYATNDAVHLNLAGYALFNKALGQNIRVKNGLAPIHANPIDVQNWFTANLPGLSWANECIIRTMIMEPGNGC